MENLIAKKYAQALLEIEGISLEDVAAELTALAELIENNSDVKEFLNSPLVKSEKKYEALVSPIEDKLDSKVINLLKLMSQKGRLAIIPELSEILTKEIKVKNNSFVGIVESGEELDSTLVKKLEKKLSAYSNSEVKLETKKSDLDGIKVEVSDLGLELNFSKQSVKNALIEHIQKAL